MPRVTRLAAVAALALALVPAVPAQAASDQAGFTRWTSTKDFSQGSLDGTSATSDAVVLGKGTSRWSYDDPRVTGGAKAYDRGTWTSPWRSTGFAAKTLVPSWSIDTPGGTWARVEVRVRSGGTVGSWDYLARYASGTSDVKRTSYSAQADDLAKVSTDTLVANSGKSFDQWQVRVVLLKPQGTSTSPTVKDIGGVAATYASRSVSTSATTMTATKDLAVPMSSQMIHAGQFPQWGGGGEAWCSPTSTSMVLRYFGTGPKPADYTWSKYADSFVDHAARDAFDHAYDGTGNWSFNTAYAARYGTDSFVTRLNDLREAEAFIKAGIPLVASVAFAKGQLTGAPLSSTPGHLLVVRGFTASGSVIVNDPASSANSTVRRTYSRSQFEKAWLKGSGGVVYVVRPTSKALPKDTARW